MRARERHLLVALLAGGRTAASLSPSFATDERVQTLNPTTTNADDKKGSDVSGRLSSRLPGKQLPTERGSL